MASSLKAVISQILVKKIGGGRVAALETLFVTPPVAANIREAKTYQIASVMQTGAKAGMVLLNDALVRLIKAKQADAKECYIKAIDKEDFIRKCSVEQIKVDLGSGAGEGPPPAPARSGGLQSF